MKLIVIESAPMSAYQMHRSEDDVQEPMLTRCLKTPKCEDDINIGTLEHPDLVQGLSGACKYNKSVILHIIIGPQ